MDWPMPKDRAIHNLFDRYPPDKKVPRAAHRRVARRVAQIRDAEWEAIDAAINRQLLRQLGGDDWDDDDTDWSFEEERPMTTTRSHHKKPPVTHVPPQPEPRPHDAVERSMAQRDSDYQQQVLEKLDEIIVCLKDLYEHMRGQ